MKKVNVKFIRPTIAQKRPVKKGETMELPRNEGLYLVNIGKAVEVTQPDYEKRDDKKKTSSKAYEKK